MKQVVIAVDLGGTNTVLGVVEKEGKVLHQVSFKTQAYPEISAFVFFGGLTKAADCFMPYLIETYQKTVFDNYKGTAKFLVSMLNDGEAALLGAAALAWLDDK